MSEAILLLIGLIVGIGISYWSDRPRMMRQFNDGYDHAVDDMLHWGCFFDQNNHKHFVNVTMVEVTGGKDAE